MDRIILVQLICTCLHPITKRLVGEEGERKRRKSYASFRFFQEDFHVFIERIFFHFGRDFVFFRAQNFSLGNLGDFQITFF